MEGNQIERKGELSVLRRDVENLNTRMSVNSRFADHFKQFCQNHERSIINTIRKMPVYIDLAKSLKPTERLEVVMPEGFGVDDIMKKKNGMLGVVLIGENGKIVKQLELQKVIEQKDIIKPLEQYAMQAQMQEVFELLTEISKGIESIRLGQLNDRFALVKAAKEQYLQATKIKNKSFMYHGISAAIITANTAREQMYMTFEEETNAFLNSKKRAGRDLQLENIQRAFQGIHDTTYINMVIYLEMYEEQALVEMARSYKEFLSNGINGSENLFEKLHSKGDLGENLWIELPRKLLDGLNPIEVGRWKLNEEKRLLISEMRGA